MSPIQATVTSHSDSTRILVQVDGHDVLIARFRSPHNAHRNALRTLLEAVALWHQQPVRVVLFADDRCDWERSGLLDALGFGHETLHYEVDIVPCHEGSIRAKRLAGLGGFAEERRRLRFAGQR